MTEPIHIDGSQGEGGGQILRTSLALAALLQQPVRLENIRANRAKPGLKTQHLAGVLALAQITEADVSGARLHSTSLQFVPRTIKGGRYRFEISTAGSACMLLGAVLPPLIFAPLPAEVIITGGTHVPYSPPFHYIDTVFLPTLRKLGGNAEVQLNRWGFYPKGGGEIRLQVKPCQYLQSISLPERGQLKVLHFSASSSENLPQHIVQREIVQVENCLADYKDKIRAESLTCRTFSPGNFVFLKAQYEHTIAGFSELGRRGNPAEEVAAEVCQAFRDFEKTAATADSHLADQLILYLALAQGDSVIVTEKVTPHLQTNMDIIRKFLPVNIVLDHTTGKICIKGTAFKVGK